MKKLLTLLTFGCILMSGTVFSQLSFNTSTTSGCTPLPVNFFNTSSGSGVHFDWYFGDGTAMYDSYNASHTYLYAGTYTVEMHAYDVLYNYLGYYSTIIDVNGQPNDYELYMAQMACPLDMLSFGTGVDAPFYTWNFGDGTTLNTSDSYVNHAYATSGIYTVSMSFYDEDCNTNYTISNDITINAGMPNFNSYVSLYIYETSVCPGATVHAGTPPGFQSYQWDFDNGTFGSNQNEEIVYNTVGLYDVSVTITNGCGQDTTLFEQVNVNNSIPAPSIPITGPTEVCIGEEFNIQANGPQDLIYTWDMGDGSPIQSGNESYEYHSYTTGGSYTVELTIENTCGNTTTQFYNIDATSTAPVYDANFQVYPDHICPGDDFNFWLPWSYDYYVDFGDGSGTTEGYSHSYTNTGTYPVYAIVQNGCGSTATLYDTVYVMNNLPITNNVYMNTYPDPACPGSDVEFYAADGFSSYSWNFGDGFTGSQQQTYHPYVNAGTYTYTVTITNGCGADTTLSNTITIQPNLPLSDLDWQVWANAACPGSTVYMSAEENDDELNVTWDYGDGSPTNNDLFTSHVYDTPGTYTVTLVAENGCGSDSTVTHNITISNSVMPQASLEQVGAQTPGCVGDNLYFIAIPAGVGTIAWDFGDGETGFSDQLIISEAQPIAAGFHAYTAAGTYNATATITNGCGNTYDTTITVVVGGPGSGIPAGVYFWHDETEISCEDQPVTFFAVGCGTYIWDFGDGSGNLITYSSLSPVEHVYQTDGSFTVTVNGFNACGSSDQGNSVIVIPDSEIDITTNTVQDSDCGVNNGVAIVTATGGTQPYSYSWTSGDQTVLADSLSSGIYVVTVTDNNGCATEAIAAVSDDQGPVIILENIVHNECFGQNNGVISVSVLGGAPPYVISWSNGDVGQDIFGLESGPYEIFVTDANGCFAAESFTVGGPEESILSIYSQPATCGSFNGEAIAVISNGTPPYTYIWPNVTTANNNTSGLAPGVHELLVIDGNACLIQKQFVVNEQNGAVIVTDSITDATCSGNLSAVYISTIGGSAPFTYDWSNSSSNQDLTNVLPGEYTVEVTGADGCSSYMFYNVSMSAPDQTDICMVTVDTNSNSNIVVWVPLNTPDVVSYNIYKESSESGLYFLVANQSADSISQYNDYASNPSIKAWRYKVAAVDDCGNIAELSDPHKTIHLSSNLGVGGVVNLIWDHYNGFAYDTYYIKRYHPSTGWMVIDSVSALNISYTDLTPPSDSNLVYVVDIVPPSTCTAFKVQDHNSSRSNKSAINMPGGPDDLGLETPDNTALSIYPNPTSGLVQLMYSSVISELRIYDLSGQLVYRANNTSNVMSVDCAEFARGVYTLQLTTETGIIYSKLVKQ